MKNKTFSFYPVVTFLLLVCMAIGCSDKDENDYQYADPSQKVVFTKFSPTSGSVRTRLFIEGSNFGKDVSKIQVFMGDVEVPVIGSTGTQIYCMVPQRAYDGTLKVIISGQDNKVIAEHIFDVEFEYVSASSVSTLVGKKDEATDKSSMIDGNFDEAEFEEPWWLLFDKNEEDERVLYVCEPAKAIRRINIDREEVSTVVTNGQGGFRSVQTMTFNHTCDTMFFADDNGDGYGNSSPVIHYAIKSENFRRVYPYVYDRCGYSCITHPDGSLFYNTYRNSSIMKANAWYNEETHQWEHKQLYNLADNHEAHTYMIMHPDGLYAYILGYYCIHKAMYNPVTKELGTPIIYVGQFDQQGYEDGPSINARFRYLRQGVFVKNHKYVEEGREDVYDFYVCDVDNHCIRKVDQDASVTTFAGRGSYSVNDIAWGYIDGELRQDARFNKPSGIAYDEENATFYIADIENRRIRYITIE